MWLKYVSFRLFDRNVLDIPYLVKRLFSRKARLVQIVSRDTYWLIHVMNSIIVIVQN